MIRTRHPEDRFEPSSRCSRAARSLEGRSLLIVALLLFPTMASAQEPGSPALDSLRAEIGRLSREYAQEAQRMMEERRADVEEHRAEIEALRERMAEGRQALADDAREAMEAIREALGARRGADRPSPGRLPPRFQGSQGPPLLFGQRMVAGAELASLNPSLARYFGVDSGVLVTEVAERSPAADAGLQPGDVVVEASGEPVETIDDLRRALSRYPVVVFRGRTPDVRPPEDIEIVLRIVREGESLDLTLPR